MILTFGEDNPNYQTFKAFDMNLSEYLNQQHGIIFSIYNRESNVSGHAYLFDADNCPHNNCYFGGRIHFWKLD